MKHLPRLVALLGVASVLVLLSACSTVSTKEPLAVTTAEELRETLEGTWTSGNGEGDTIMVAFDEEGKGELAYLERMNDEFSMGKGELAAVVVDDRNFLSLRFEEDGELPETHLFVEYVITDSNDLVIWPPDAKRFQKALKNGELEGSDESDKYSTSIVLNSKAAAVLEFLKAHPEASNSRQPTVLRKLGE